MIRLDAGVASDLDAGARREWLETDGTGGFAMGTVAGPSTRRYHALLCVATRPPASRMVLVNAFEEWLYVGGAHLSLSSHFFPGVVHPRGHESLVEFRLDPWPTWLFRVGGLRVVRTLFMPHGSPKTVVSWRLADSSGDRARLVVRPLLSGRDYHSLHYENSAACTDAEADEGRVSFRPYDGAPRVWVHHNGVYRHAPEWWRAFEYPREQERGLAHREDLLSPGDITFDLTGAHPAIAILSLDEVRPDPAQLEAHELARRSTLAPAGADPLVRRLCAAADQFIVRRAQFHTIIAGYPWFTDWGRDTFISLPGLLGLPSGRDHARDLLCAFAAHIQDGLIPNRFPDENDLPEYNTVDAPLWFVLAICRFARASGDRDLVRKQLVPTIHAIFDAYLGGTRFGIGVDDDGLIHAQSAGHALTWMDARVGDWVVTPRHGKPVEIQALWVAALEAVARLTADWDKSWAGELLERAAWARSSFAASFFCEEKGWLYDVIDGTRRDATLRPNQLFALGLCAPLIDQERALKALAAVEQHLLTPVGLRTRAPGDGYIGIYGGDQRARDAAYHEGTVWPWLLGIYADACTRLRGSIPPNLLYGLRNHLFAGGLGQLHEIHDGDAPHAPRGCPAQAWSVFEALRIATGHTGEDA